MLSAATRPLKIRHAPSTNSRLICGPGALIALVVALSGCGEVATPERSPDPDPAAPPALRRLEVAREPADLEVRRVAHYTVGEPGEPWRIDSETFRVSRGDDGVATLLLQGAASHRIWIPVPREVGIFSAIDVEVIGRRQRGQMTARVELWSEDAELLRSEVQTPEPKRGPQTLRFFLPQVRRLKGVQQVRLVLRTDEVGAAVRGVDLMQIPPLHLLPAPGRGTMTRVGGEGRRAVGFSCAAGLRAWAPAGSRDALRFSLALPERLADSAHRVTATVIVEGRGVLTRRIPLAESGVWTTHSLEVGEVAVAGQELSVRFELSARDEEEREADAFALLGEPMLIARDPEAPTVLFITSDTHRADHLGTSHGSVDVSTPVLDALAARGVLFEECFSSTNSTNPSHTALLTGLHPRDHGILNNSTVLSDRADTLAETFGAAGYVTWACVSARHLTRAGLDQGFDRMDGPETSQRPASETLETLTRWLDDAAGAPLFLWVHFFDAHTPYEPPPEYARRYWSEDSDPRDPKLPTPAHEDYVLASLRGIRDPAYIRAMYRAEVASLDEALGRLLDLDRLRDAVVCLTGDHGESLGQNRVYFSHDGLFPGNLHVPLILSAPAAARGLRVQRPVSNVDVGRTLLDLAAVEGSFPGRNLLQPEGRPVHRFSLHAHASSASITDSSGWHLVLSLVEGGGFVHSPRQTRRHQVELYHLPSDPHCLQDRIEEEPARARPLRHALAQWLQAAAPTTLAQTGSLDEAERRELEALGYAEETGETSRLLFDPDCTCEDCARFR